MKETTKNCDNCHFRSKGANEDSCNECYMKFGLPAWHPFTNGDKVRGMTDEELVALWGKVYFADEYHADCQECGKVDKCSFWQQCCPETFRRWLGAEAKE